MADDRHSDSAMDETSKPKYAKPFIIWSFWNIIRYVVIGCFIFLANRQNATTLNSDYRPYCCGCYFVATDSEKYVNQSSTVNEIKGKRFDLSFAIPQCTNCTYCNATQFDHKFENITCSMQNYTYNNKHFHSNWYDFTGCPKKHISITSMKYFVKSYQVYGSFALGVTIAYSTVNLVFIIFALFCMNDMHQTFFRWTWIYNIFITNICLYLMFKPFQYYGKSITTKDGHDIKCQIDSISEMYEDILTVSIPICLILITAHFLWMIGWIIFYICKCINSYQRDHRGRNESISMGENSKIQKGGKAAGYIELSSNKGYRKKFACLWGFIGIVVFIVMLFFLVLTIIIAVKSLDANHRDETPPLDQKWIYTAYVLLGLSLIDSPWFWRNAQKVIKVRLYRN